MGALSPPWAGSGQMLASGFKKRVCFFLHSAGEFAWSPRRDLQEMDGSLNLGSFWPLDFTLIADHPGGRHSASVG